MTSSIAFALTDGDIKQALNALARCHPPIATALNQVGYPASRQREHSFESLARIVIGQQLSTKAAATIAGRVDVVCGGVVTPKSILATPLRRSEPPGCHVRKSATCSHSRKQYTQVLYYSTPYHSALIRRSRPLSPRCEVSVDGQLTCI